MNALSTPVIAAHLATVAVVAAALAGRVTRVAGIPRWSAALVLASVALPLPGLGPLGAALLAWFFRPGKPVDRADPIRIGLPPDPVGITADRRQSRPIIALLASGSVEERRETLLALRSADTPAARELLVKATRDPDGYVSASAQAELQRRGEADERLFARLEELVSADDADRRASLALAEQLVATAARSDATAEARDGLLRRGFELAGSIPPGDSNWPAAMLVQLEIHLLRGEIREAQRCHHALARTGFRGASMDAAELEILAASQDWGALRHRLRSVRLRAPGLRDAHAFWFPAARPPETP